MRGSTLKRPDNPPRATPDNSFRIHEVTTAVTTVGNGQVPSVGGQPLSVIHTTGGKDSGDLNPRRPRGTPHQQQKPSREHRASAKKPPPSTKQVLGCVRGREPTRCVL